MTYDYIDLSETGCVRIFDGFDGIEVDGATLDHKQYTEQAWTHWHDQFITVRTAILAAREFARMIRSDGDVPIYVEFGRDDWRLLPRDATELPEDCAIMRVRREILASSPRRPADDTTPTDPAPQQEGTVAEAVQKPVKDQGESAVHHPQHYGGADNPYEAIKVIEAWGLGFHLGNTVKYISRAGRKDSSKELEDLRKARWYLDREIQRREHES